MQFGLIGYPLSHSFSKKYFTEKFHKEGSSDFYELFPIRSIEEFPELLMSNPLNGLNVTIPYKEQVIRYLDELSPEALKAGAVNTIKIVNGKTKGYNTDIYGFRNSLKPFLEPQHQKALILGTGGASKAVAYAFDELGIDYYFVSRTKKQGLKCFAYDELNEYILKSFLLIVNCTPLGMYPAVETEPSIPYQYLTERHFLYDLVYNPTETVFLKKGKEKGSRVMNGMDMLVLQAERAWQIWNEPGL
jgi:shikimate dehydrogenase